MSDSKLSPEPQEPTAFSAIASIHDDLAGPNGNRQHSRLMARILISRLEEMGYAIVPMEPTSEMLDALTVDGWLDCHREWVLGIWRDALAARPR